MTPIELKTERLVLREWVEQDLAAVQQYATDPEVVRYMPWGPNTDEQSLQFLRECIAAQHQDPRCWYEFAITLRDSGELIGGCGLRLQDAIHRTGDFGYALRRDCWGRGYATECARVLLQFGFTELRMHRIAATCDARNTVSAHILQKVGLQPEGKLRSNTRQHGEWRDTLLFAILEEEFNTEAR